MWYFIILGVILLGLNWILPAITKSPWVYAIGDFELQLWLAGVIALAIGLVWLVVAQLGKKK